MAANFSFSAFEQAILAHCDADLLGHTRVHRLPTFDLAEAKVWLKREDELGFGISGSKKRKYASLIPALRKQQVPLVGLVGGARSNHIVGMVQLLRENRIPLHLFLKQTHHASLQGNRFLLDLLVDPKEVSWIAPHDWTEVEEYVWPHLRAMHPEAVLIPEGGSCQEALPGALSLGLDVLDNESEKDISFDHIWVDSGTGLTAGALASALAVLGRDTTVHVVLTAGTQAYLEAQFATIAGWGKEMGFWQSVLPKVAYHAPLTAKSFGAINQTVLQATRQLARVEGILTDPIYTTKLLLTAQSLIKTQPLGGNVLIIHTGGGTGLFGFAEKLRE